ncbi:thiamine pyrophosphate-dependent dehydrogenase E1 component subunit alpha [Phytohabitans suffuscus]|uniref:Pyruvate dehydrogenase E1 component subunit alpha n=1 Tax=Phytohabitans suffuscus TaxID=624315 RepID=A0A6F8YQW0_9ACTN|nr:thiamine pyrophosphate-dependent dehydrogenase E1 component subunit alpha [Phytohabitans suffuscus]BCB88575.1 pyruvate dehydrogenase E1 component subunit alpha [Phytohabitans suffuscus]
MKPDDSTLLDIYRIARRIRSCDDLFWSMLSAGQVQMTYYSPMGQEVISAATGVALRSDDYVVTTYRGLHDHIAKGVPLRELWAEFFGRATGTCKGKGGPMHITHPASGLMVTTGLVGAGLPIGVGFAVASVLEGADRVTVVNFGDGATNIGAFHEALNLAALWNLPVVFVCQNNQYGEKTALRDHLTVEHIADRGAAYNMRSLTVDGNDPDAMFDAISDAIGIARAGNGPTLLEANTFRFRGHNFGDDNAYIPDEEMAAAKANDPLPRLRDQLIFRGIADQATLDAVDAAVMAEVEDARNFAEQSPMPPISELGTDVYKTEVAV